MPRIRMYSAEFKREAAALANQPGVTNARIGRELDVSPNVITLRSFGAATSQPKCESKSGHTQKARWNQLVTSG
jgi:transposase-like protein